MIFIRFMSDEAKRRAVEFLVGRFSFKSWSSGEMIVEDAALAALARENIPYAVEGPATYEQRIPALRVPAAHAV